MKNTQTYIGASNRATKVVADIIDGITSGLPKLPKKLRYYDDFESTFFTINDFSNQRQIVLRQNGMQVTTYFDFEGSCRDTGKKRP